MLYQSCSRGSPEFYFLIKANDHQEVNKNKSRQKKELDGQREEWHSALPYRNSNEKLLWKVMNRQQIFTDEEIES